MKLTYLYVSTHKPNTQRKIALDLCETTVKKKDNGDKVKTKTKNNVLYEI